MEKRSHQQVFRDPLYGYIRVDYQVITDLINSSVFQRLRRIRQLSGVHMVFHSAEHSRFTHSLGAYELANKFLEVPSIKEALDQRSQLLFLASALLHDIGHGAYSHAFEYAFHVNHEYIGANLIENHPEIRSILNAIDGDFAKDVASIILKTHKFSLIEQMISSQLDVDRLDYLERDAYFTGAAYGHIDLDRLLRVVTVKDNHLVFKASGIHAIENYLVSRYHMYWQVYYHPKARAYEVILEKIYLRIKDLLAANYEFKHDVTALQRLLKNPNDMYAYIEVDDYYMNGLIAYFQKTDDDILRNLSMDFLNRRMWSYLDVNIKNKVTIEDILKNYTKEELKYYKLETTVAQTTYEEDTSDLGKEIMVLLEDGKVSPLSKYSAIIHSLITSGVKSDPKFFYRRK